MNYSVIYRININGKFYIGSAVDYWKRTNEHLRKLFNKIHPNNHLQLAFNKHDSICIDVLEEVNDKNNLLIREEFWIEHYKSYDREFGYNKRRKPNSNLGLKLPQSKAQIEHRASLLRGRKRAPEVVERMRLRMIGKKQSEESKLKKSLSTKGRLKSKEHKIKIGIGNRKSNKWPHADGAWCKCRECLDKKNEISKNYPSYKRKLAGYRNGLSETKT